MLNASDLKGLVKQGQDSLFGAFKPVSVPTLMDLTEAIKADRGLSPVEEQRLLSEIRALSMGHSANTPISSLMYQGFGGILGALISKYFGLGTMGQVISSFAGFGLGTALYNKLNAPPNPYKGYKLLS